MYGSSVYDRNADCTIDYSFILILVYSFYNTSQEVIKNLFVIALFFIF
ncbi:protein of unknown function [Candidatus Nitrosocosmicus franklandus]|uniref:Uncharacterized protein n=1 Tax=Candidatus Nitrosocosmicus franklandianus TaxID=1798806 RepID=A0A484I9X7_9ARCH|nr:protein of unknown function [Candidatus Nitrosocosmicus franklandus]